MYKEQPEIQKNMIAMLKEQLAYKEEKLQECEKKKKYLQILKKWISFNILILNILQL
jgi:hypothetical protein